EESLKQVDEIHKRVDENHSSSTKSIVDVKEIVQALEARIVDGEERGVRQIQRMKEKGEVDMSLKDRMGVCEDSVERLGKKQEEAKEYLSKLERKVEEAKDEDAARDEALQKETTALREDIVQTTKKIEG
ncbi:hypothetical protein ADUPG1_004306, partial [Aduncisulcus paluster]